MRGETLRKVRMWGCLVSGADLGGCWGQKSRKVRGVSLYVVVARVRWWACRAQRADFLCTDGMFVYSALSLSSSCYASSLALCLPLGHFLFSCAFVFSLPSTSLPPPSAISFRKGQSVIETVMNFHITLELMNLIISLHTFQ